MPTNKLFVGNLRYSVTADELRDLFSQYGDVRSITVIEGKGFGFVEMASQAEAEKAKSALNNKEFAGRALRVDDAKPRENRPRGDGPRGDRPPRNNRGDGGSRRY